MKSSIHAETYLRIGDFFNVLITSATEFDLEGVISENH